MEKETFGVASRVVVAIALAQALGCGDDASGGGGAGGEESSSRASGSMSATASGGTTTSDAAASSGSTGVGGSGGAAPETSRVRVGHFAPDAPPVDYCYLLPSGGGVGPVLAAAGRVEGIRFGEVTPWLEVDRGIYTVRIVGAGAADCDEGLADFEDVLVPEGFTVTAAAVGFVDPSSGPPLELAFWIDDVSPPTEGADGGVKMRFIHLVPGAAAVDFGRLVDGADVLPPEDETFSEVGYKLTGSPPYRTVALDGEDTWRVQLSADQTPVAQAQLVDLEPGMTFTVFAHGAPDDARILACVESEGDGSCASTIAR